jgi:hypothetical protein
MTPHSVRIDGVERAVLWALIDSKLFAAPGTVPLPAKTFVLAGSWKLGTKLKRSESVAVLAEFARIASGMRVSAWAVCCQRTFPRPFAIRRAGLLPTHRVTRLRVFLAATPWKQQVLTS